MLSFNKIPMLPGGTPTASDDEKAAVEITPQMSTLWTKLDKLKRKRSIAGLASKIESFNSRVSGINSWLGRTAFISSKTKAILDQLAADLSMAGILPAGDQSTLIEILEGKVSVPLIAQMLLVVKSMRSAMEIPTAMTATLVTWYGGDNTTRSIMSSTEPDTTPPDMTAADGSKIYESLPLVMGPFAAMTDAPAAGAFIYGFDAAGAYQATEALSTIFFVAVPFRSTNVVSVLALGHVFVQAALRGFHEVAADIYPLLNNRIASYLGLGEESADFII